jgi:hypothetical protein
MRVRGPSHGFVAIKCISSAEKMLLPIWRKPRKDCLRVIIRRQGNSNTRFYITLRYLGFCLFNVLTFANKLCTWFDFKLPINQLMEMWLLTNCVVANFLALQVDSRLKLPYCTMQFSKSLFTEAIWITGWRTRPSVRFRSCTPRYAPSEKKQRVLSPLLCMWCEKCLDVHWLACG